jgi:glucan 1,3-beta-glucosidase
MRSKPIRGVNLGGWLVLEKWITPNLFKDTDAQDEYSFCNNAGKQELQKLKKFRDHFITKSDFEWLAEHGIEAVRLPIGYWAFGNASPYLSTVEYLDKAFAWAEETGLKILLDLHGAHHSQNGRDHSGRSGETQWHRDEANITETVETIKGLASRYGKHHALLGISLLNEPRSTIQKTILLDYYKQAYTIIRRICGDHVWVVYDDGYNPSRWRKELPAQSFKNVCIDTHQYQIFTPLDKRLPPWLNLSRTRLRLPRKLARLRKYHSVIVGEWSLALDNGKLGRLSTLKRRRIAQAYARAQLDAYDVTMAWFFWTYKTDQGGIWSFRDCTEKKLLPKLVP